MEMQPLKTYDLDDLVPILKASRRTINTYLRSGKLKGIKVGRKWVVKHETLIRFLNK